MSGGVKGRGYPAPAEDREWYVRENAIAIVQAKEQQIALLRRVIRKLETRIRSYKQELRIAKERHSMETPEHFPTVVWMGSMPIGKTKRLFRLVHRGPARPNRPDDVPFAIEQRVGQNMMKKYNWSKPTRGDGGQEEAIWALSHALGLALMIKPEALVQDHPIHCELNIAILEGRPARGCDCNGPDDPTEKVP